MAISKNMKRLIAAGAALVLILIVAFSWYGRVNGLRNEGVGKESALVAQYSDNQNELSKYTTQIRESLGVADKGSEKLNEILTNAVQGRYDGKMEPGTSGSMFSAISEAYPDLTATTESYSKVQDLVVSGRQAYANKQSKLLDMVRDYNTWRETDIVNSWIIKNALGFPSDNLKVTVGDNTFRGVDALDKLSRVIVTQDTVDTYNNGTLEPLIDGTDEN